MLHHGQHDAYVGQAHLMQLLEGSDLQTEVICLSQVAPYASPAEHWIMFMRFVLAALHGPELICWGIQSAHPDRPRVESIRNYLDALHQLADVLLGLTVLDVPVGGLAKAQDHVLNAQQSNAVCLRCSCGSGTVRLADIDFYLCGSYGFREDHASCTGCRRGLGRRGQRHETFIDDALTAVYCNLHAVLQGAGGFFGSNHSRTAQLTTYNGCVTCHATFIRDNGSRALHARNHIRHGHLGDHDVALLDLIQLSAAGNYSHNTCANARGGAKPIQENLAAASSCRSSWFFSVVNGSNRPGLKDVDLVLLHAPLDILRDAVVILQDLGVLGQFHNLIIGKNCCLLLLGRDLDRDRLQGLGVPDDHDLFGCDVPACDILGLPVYNVVIRRDTAAHHRLAQTPCPFNDHLGFAGAGLGAEHYA